MGYLSTRALNGLKAYEYKPGGYTWLDNIHRPALDWCVSWLPRWLAPNLITLLGTLGLVASYLVSAYYAPDFVGDTPRWVYLFAAFSVVFYTWLDCFDGKQARRTGTSSPLGQLFDHGCDALSVNLLLANIGCSLGMTCGWAHAIGNVLVMFIWICAQWEEYHTGLMLYGNEYFGVLECNYSLAAVHLVTFILGPDFYLDRVGDYVDLPIIRNWLVNEFVICFFITIGSYQALCNIWRVYNYDTSVLPAKERGHKQLGQGSAAAHLVLMVAMVALGGLWLWQPTDQLYLCRAENIGVGIAYALFASTLIMAHMCKEPFQPPMWALVVMGLGIMNKVLHVVDPLQLTICLDVLLLAGYLHYVVVVINQICEHLDINCLTIKPKAAA